MHIPNDNYYSGMPEPPNVICFIECGGRKIAPKDYVLNRAFYKKTGDQFKDYIEAENEYRKQGIEIISDEEWRYICQER